MKKMPPTSENVSIKAATELSKGPLAYVYVGNEPDTTLEQSKSEKDSMNMKKSLDLEQTTENKEDENLILEKVQASNTVETVIPAEDLDKQTHETRAHSDLPVSQNSNPLSEEPIFKLFSQIDAEEAENSKKDDVQLSTELENEEKSFADKKGFLKPSQNSTDIENKQNSRMENFIPLGSDTGKISFSFTETKEEDELLNQKLKETPKKSAMVVTVSDACTDSNKPTKLEMTKDPNSTTNLKQTTKIDYPGEKTQHHRDSTKYVTPQKEENEKEGVALKVDSCENPVDERDKTQQETISRVKLVKKKKKKSKQDDVGDLIEFQSVLQENPQESIQE